MSLVDTVSILVCVAALFSYVNYRFIKLPHVIGLMALALAASLGIAFMGRFGLTLSDGLLAFIRSIDFNRALMTGMLSFLLFAGALQVNLTELLEQKYLVGSLASVGVLLSAGLIGFAGHFLFRLLGVDLPLVACLLFGALISPTDPVAVLGIVRKAGMRKSLETTIVAESLLNDGVGVVVFLVILEAAASGQSSAAGAALLFLREAVGGAALGLATGTLAYWMLKGVDEYQLEILITLALVMGTYSLAQPLHASGPLAVVVAGLLIGNHGRNFAMSEGARVHLDEFWQMIDELLNAVLFVLMGLEMVVLEFRWRYLAAGLVAIPLVLAARYISVSLPLRLLRRRGGAREKTDWILTWGGLRGGLAVAMALSIPRGGWRDAIVTITYTVVVFSILVQGLTIGRLVRSVPARES
ncbi:MAG TPA: sodium:proton antiporter [Elusimicrobiota bacterium]|nr:sodium:proton antiporter [Elusimicrobiota bacterium]